MGKSKLKNNNYFIFSATLLIICLCSSGLLALVYKTTKPIIDARMLAEEKASLKSVFPEADVFMRVKLEGSNDINHYEAVDSKKNLIGYAFKAEKRGYSSIIQTMVGVIPGGKITNIKVMYQRETPGLGSKIEEVKKGQTQSWFQAQFSGKIINILDKDIQAVTGATISSKTIVDSIDNIQAVTGATISSKAVLDSIKEKATHILQVMRDKDINFIRDEF